MEDWPLRKLEEIEAGKERIVSVRAHNLDRILKPSKKDLRDRRIIAEEVLLELLLRWRKV